MDTTTNNSSTETDKKIELLFENMLNGFAYCKMVFDDKGTPVDWIYLKVNRAFEKITGLKDVVGKPVSIVLPDLKKANPELFTTYGTVSNSGNPAHLEIFVVPLSQYLSITVYCPEQGYFVAVFEDVTQRKNSEETLKRDEERLTLALKAAKMGVWDWNIVTNTIYWSPEMMEISGKESFDGTFETFKSIIHPEDVDRVLKEVNEAVATGKEYEIEFRMIRPDGRSIWISTFGKVFYDDQHKPIRMVGSSQDITERKNMTDEFKKKTEEMEKFINLTVGRELKMQELKSKINDLEGTKDAVPE